MTMVGNQLISLLVGLVFGVVVTYITTERKMNTTIRLAVRTLLKAEISGEWRRLNERNFVYLHELDITREVYEQYKVLGGNAGVSLLMEDIEKLPRKSTNDKINI